MNLVLAGRVIADRRRWLVGWSIGVAGYAVMNIAFWPAIDDQAEVMNEMIDRMPESLQSLFGMGGGIDPFSPVGYLSSQLYALALPLLLLIAAIGVAGSLAGDEERGLLEITYTLPITRTRVVAERWLALMVLTGVLALVSMVAVLISTRVVGLEVGVAPVAWATLSATLLTWAVAGIGLAVGAASGSRGAAITVPAVVAVASYVVTSLADAGIGFFRSIETVSLFTRYGVVETLAGSTPLGSAVTLLVVAAAAVAVAMWAINRRDLRAG
ncbi:MAG: ABC transporter permease subunit [Ilumatobacteraceae bacterium]